MDAFVIDWLNLLFRWAHLIVGVGWIGTSFYFIVLDLSLKKRRGQAAGVMGSSWLVHGGGFYNVEKYTSAPDHLPDDLIWYKWEAYLTWVTGFALIILQYYLNAGSYLIDPSVMPLQTWQAVALSLTSLALGWLVYHGLCKLFLGRNNIILAVGVFAFVIAVSYFYTQVFSGRGALIHVGALIGTMMAFNVFMIIIPNQKKIIASLIAGEKPDPALGITGKQRSVHNNYFTLPVLLMMVSSHYPMLTGHPYSWLLVALVIVMGGCVRHFLNLHEADQYASEKRAENYSWYLLVAAVLLVVALVMTAPRDSEQIAAAPVSDREIMAIAAKHCTSCHAASPAHAAFREAPKGVMLDSVENWVRFAPTIKAQTVDSNMMPLGNQSGMTADERAKVAAWLGAIDMGE